MGSGSAYEDRDPSVYCSFNTGAMAVTLGTSAPQRTLHASTCARARTALVLIAAMVMQLSFRSDMNTDWAARRAPGGRSTLRKASGGAGHLARGPPSTAQDLLRGDGRAARRRLHQGAERR
jgi:hypothetical protein